MSTQAKRSGAGSQRSGSGPVSRSPALKAEDFEAIRHLLREEAAIDLELGKGYFVEARLDALAAREGFPSSGDLMASLKLGKNDGLRMKVVGALTQNETSFFRDARPFEELRRSILPDLIARRAEHRRLKIWSAACSRISAGDIPSRRRTRKPPRCPSLHSCSIRPGNQAMSRSVKPGTMAEDVDFRSFRSIHASRTGELDQMFGPRKARICKKSIAC